MPKKSIYGTVIEEGRHRYFKVVMEDNPNNQNSTVKVFHRDVIMDIPVNEEVIHKFVTRDLEYFGNLLKKEREIKMESLKEHKDDNICEVLVCQHCGKEVGISDVITEENETEILSHLTCLNCKTRGEWKKKDEEVICG